jgi:hypothetical protein
MTEILADIKVTINKNGAYELAKMTKEQYVQFRYHFVEEHMYNKTWCENTNKKAMELLLSALVLILCKKVPVECDIKNIAKLTDRVKLVKAPVDAFAKSKPFSAVVR